MPKRKRPVQKEKIEKVTIKNEARRKFNGRNTENVRDRLIFRTERCTRSKAKWRMLHLLGAGLMTGGTGWLQA
jgi:hypothetical protein